MEMVDKSHGTSRYLNMTAFERDGKNIEHFGLELFFMCVYLVAPKGTFRAANLKELYFACQQQQLRNANCH